MKQYQIEITKIGRKNYKALCDGKYTVDISMASFPGLAVGDKLTVAGEWESSRYGSSFVAYSQEEVADRAEKSRQDEIAKWWGYMENAHRQGYIYAKGVDKLWELGDHTHDAQINAWRKEIEAAKAAQRAEYEAYKASCAANRAADRAAEEAKYTHLALPASNGRPANGEIMIRKGRAFHVVSARYESQDGMSFGAMSDEWYSVKALDITDTDAGREALAKAAAEAAERKAARERRQHHEQTLDAIRETIISTGKRPENAQPAGEIVLNTFTIYGGGERIYKGDCFAWYVQNNGSDGDDWSLNNCRTGGAGAIAWVAPMTDELKALIGRL